MLAEIVSSNPGKVITHITEAMTFSREDEEVKALIGLDERVGQPQSVGWMDIVVDVARSNKESTFQIFSDL
jgi:hypothetical protein